MEQFIFKTSEELGTMSRLELHKELSNATVAQLRGNINGNQLFRYHMEINDLLDGEVTPSIEISIVN